MNKINLQKWSRKEQAFLLKILAEDTFAILVYMDRFVWRGVKCRPEFNLGCHSFVAVRQTLTGIGFIDLARIAGQWVRPGAL